MASLQNYTRALLLGGVLLAFVSVLVACDKDDDEKRDVEIMNNPTTRAMTHEDSIAAGLIITVENDGEWDGEDEHDF